MSRAPAPAPGCLPCALIRSAGRALALVLLPRTFSFLCALVILVLMAPSSLPTPKPALPPGAAFKGSLQAAAQSLKDAAASAATAAAASAAAPAVARAAAAASAANAAAAALVAKVNTAASAAAAAASALGAKTPAGISPPATAPTTAVATAVAPPAGASGSPLTAGAAPAATAAAASPAANGATGASAAAASTAASAPLRFSPTTLPSGRVGRVWGPRKMVELGKPPYAMAFVGEHPAWITQYQAGTLSGTPDKAGTYTFTLRAVGQGQPQQAIEQTFSVRVLEAGPEATATKPAKAPAVAEPAPPPTTDRYLPQTFRLEAADLAEWPWDAKPPAEAGPLTGPATEPATSGAATSSAAAAAGIPLKKGWTDMLAPLQGLDYPSEALFRRALTLAHCSAYQALAEKGAKDSKPGGKPGKPGNPVTGAVEVECPAQAAMLPKDRLAEGESCAAGLPPPSGAFESLMPPAVRECLVQRARRVHPPQAQIPTLWAATPGCGCVSPAKDNEVFGFLSYWGTTEQQQAAAALAAANPASAPGPGSVAAARQIDFGLYTRISYFGAVLNDKGDYLLPRDVALQGARLAHDALQHQTQTDLVVYRNDWDLLLKQDWAAPDKPPRAIENFINDAARNAALLVDAEQPYVSTAYQHLLLPFWRERTWAYGGITVFFDNAPEAGTPGGARFSTFLRRFMDALIVQLQQRPQRAYHLNVVVPGDRLGDDGPFNFRDLNSWIEAAERAQTSKKVEADKKTNYRGKTDITVEYIVLLSDPATDSKKAVRARMDSSEALSGITRVAFLQSTVPLLLRPAAVQPRWLSKSPDAQWDDELAYMKWNFGGVSVWEPPASGAGDGVLRQHLLDNFRDEAHLLTGLCNWVCPNRLPLRLLLQSLVLVGGLAFGVWLMSCTVRSWGRPYRYFLGGGFVVTVLLFQAMLQCDPSLARLRDSPLPALIYLALVLGVIGRFIFSTSREDAT